MLAEALVLAAAFEVGPFYEQRRDYAALRPFASSAGETADGVHIPFPLLGHIQMEDIR